MSICSVHSSSGLCFVPASQRHSCSSLIDVAFLSHVLQRQSSERKVIVVSIKTSIHFARPARAQVHFNGLKESTMKNGQATPILPGGSLSRSLMHFYHYLTSVIMIVWKPQLCCLCQSILCAGGMPVLMHLMD